MWFPFAVAIYSFLSASISNTKDFISQSKERKREPGFGLSIPHSTSQPSGKEWKQHFSSAASIPNWNSDSRNYYKWYKYQECRQELPLAWVAYGRVSMNFSEHNDWIGWENRGEHCKCQHKLGSRMLGATHSHMFVENVWKFLNPQVIRSRLSPRGNECKALCCVLHCANEYREFLCELFYTRTANGVGG